MKDILGIIKKNKNNYAEKTFVTSGLSMLVGVVFFIYNGILGVMYGAVWNISICVYYAVLSTVKAFVIFSARKTYKGTNLKTKNNKRRIFIVSHIVMLFMDFVLIAPIMDMALGHRDYTYGLIPAIIMAAYTTFRVVTSIVHYRKSRKSKELFVAELRTINMIDALVAVLTLQNSMIIANGGFYDGMRILTVYTSVGILILIFAITIVSFGKGRNFEHDSEV